MTAPPSSRLEFARRCALDFGMQVFMGDVDAAALSREAGLLAAAADGGGDATAVPTDVRKREDVVRLLEAAQAAGYGCVDAALFNAGVLGAGVSAGFALSFCTPFGHHSRPASTSDSRAAHY